VISIFLKYGYNDGDYRSLRLKKFNLDEMNPLAVIVAIGNVDQEVFSSQRLVAAPVLPVGLVMSAMANKFFGDFVWDVSSTK
jgi:hypothetical protein